MYVPELRFDFQRHQKFWQLKLNGGDVIISKTNSWHSQWLCRRAEHLYAYSQENILFHLCQRRKFVPKEIPFLRSCQRKAHHYALAKRTLCIAHAKTSTLICSAQIRPLFYTHSQKSNLLHSSQKKHFASFVPRECTSPCSFLERTLHFAYD